MFEDLPGEKHALVPKMPNLDTDYKPVIERRSTLISTSLKRNSEVFDDSIASPTSGGPEKRRSIVKTSQ